MVRIGWVACLLLVVPSGAGRAQDRPKPANLALEGTWDLNIAKSEEPGARMRRGGPGYGGRGGFPRGRGGWGGRGGMPDSPPEGPPDGGASGASMNGFGMVTAYRLVITQSDTLLLMTIPGNSIRRIRLDRPESADTTIDGRIIRIKTKLEADKLEIDRQSDLGKVSERYQLDRETGELVIKTKLSGRRGSVSFKRVYVRSKEPG